MTVNLTVSSICANLLVIHTIRLNNEAWLLEQFLLVGQNVL
jgi:hypothetical protein